MKVDSPRDTTHQHCLRVHRAVVEAERARARGDHDGMVAHRRLLKQLAPGVFVEYMAL